MSPNSYEYKRRNMQLWDEVAPRYHKRWASATRGPIQSAARLVEYAGIKRGDAVLDIACGTGAVTRRIARKVGASGSVIGADTSVGAMRIAQAQSRGARNVTFLNADAENVSFASKFDAITCQFALFYFPNAAAALKNMRRSLREGGTVGISVHGSRKRVPFFGAIFAAMTEFIPDYLPAGSPDLERYGTKKALRDEVKGAGFARVVVRDHDFRYSPGTFEDYWTDYTRYVPSTIKAKLAALGRGERARLKDMVRENTRPYTKRGGTIDFPWQVLILAARN